LGKAYLGDGHDLIVNKKKRDLFQDPSLNSI
jgi:hypothetical protein